MDGVWSRVSLEMAADFLMAIRHKCDRTDVLRTDLGAMEARAISRTCSTAIERLFELRKKPCRACQKSLGWNSSNMRVGSEFFHSACAAGFNSEG